MDRSYGFLYFFVSVLSDMPVNLEEIVNLFEGLHPRMMQFASLLYE